MAGPLNSIGDQIKASLATIFMPEEHSPPGKQVRTSSDGRSQGPSGSKRGASPTSRVPFSANQCAWLQNAVGASLATFGEHVEQRVGVVEAKVEATNKEVAELRQHVKDLQERINNNDSGEWAERIKRVEEHAKKAVADAQKVKEGAQQGQGGSSTGKIMHAPATPYEQRTVARIGSLGWDTEKKVLQERALAVLKDAGVDPQTYTALVPVCGRSGKGSAAELLFRTPAGLQAARLQVRSLGREFDAGKPSWLDAKKERAELKPARVIHRIAEVLQEFENNRDDKGEVKKDTIGKTVSVSGHRACFTLNGSLKWSAWAVARYPQSELEWAQAFAESD
jgi:hypothetical protein